MAKRKKNANISVLSQSLIHIFILAKVIRGELSINDPGEESAVELLKKIL